MQTHDSLMLAGCLVAAVIVSTVYATARQYWRLRHFRGPPGTGLSKWWLASAICGTQSHQDFREATDKYGSIARIAPNDLATSDPGLVKHMFAVRSEYRRSSWYDGTRLKPTRNNVLSTRDENEHTKLRSKMSPGYSGKEVENLERKIDENVLALIRLIDRYVDAGEPVDLAQKAQFMTLDVISDLAFGNPLGFLKTDSDVHDYIKTTESQVPIFVFATVFPWIIRVLGSPLLTSLLPSENDVVGFGKIMGVAKKVVSERFGPDKKVEKDMLGSFVAHGMTQDEVEGELALQLVAGSDTTATAIRTTLLHLITNPRVHGKLRAEVLACSEEAQSTSDLPPSSVVSSSASRPLPYLQAVIKEGLRLYPPTVGLASKVVPPQGDEWKGVHLPGGTCIGVSILGIVRSKDIWGADADEFRPERWLEGPPERTRELESTLDLVFSYGKWQCLGRPVALMELSKVMFELTRRYDLCVVDPANPWKSINHGVFFQSDLWVRGYHRGI